MAENKSPDGVGMQDASAGLKAMLGVKPNNAEAPFPPRNAIPLPQPPPPPPPPRPATAADALFQMMMNEQTVPPSVPAVPSHQPSQPTFNFTYVKEGEEPAAQVPPPQEAINAPYGAGMAGVIHPTLMNPHTMMVYGGAPVYPAVATGPPAVVTPVITRDKTPKSSNGAGGPVSIIPSAVVTGARKSNEGDLGIVK